MAFALPFASAVAAGATGTGIAAASFVGPLTIGQSLGVAIGSSLGTVGTILTGLGGLASSRAEASAAKSNAALMDYNRQVHERNALLATKSAALKASEQARENRRKLGTIRSAYSKAGVVTTAGSPLLTQQIQAGEGEMEVRKILYEGLIQSSSEMSEASISKFKSAMELNKAKSARQSGMFSLGKTILTGGTSLLS